MKIIFAIVGLTLFALSLEARPWVFKQDHGLSYEIYIPDAPSTSLRPLMINLHGCGQTAKDLSMHGNWEPAAEKYAAVVVAPQVPAGGPHPGCWNYYGSDHSIDNKNNVVLIQLIESLLADSSLNLDSHRVYITGLSSGGGEALLIGCLRPDLVAGVGLNSSPAIPSEAQDISSPQITADQMAKFCLKLAEGRNSFFQTQMISVIVGDRDYVVSPEYSKIIVDAMKSLFATTLESKLDLQSLEGTNRRGQGFLYSRNSSKPSISWIINENLGHNWPAGGGLPGGAFIEHQSLNYPLYVLDFLEASNSRRASLK